MARTFPRIAIAKVGWCVSYAGDPVQGRSAYIRTHSDAHERFNFRKWRGREYFGYIPPIGPTSSPPRPPQPDGWLVVFVAPRGGDGPLVPVGWYEEASFSTEYQPRPEYSASAGFWPDSEGNDYVYVLRSAKAKLITQAERARHPLPGTRMRKTPLLYARSPHVSDSWRRSYAKWAENLIAAVGTATLDQVSSSGGFAGASVRREVETRSVAATRSWLQSRGYTVTDRQRGNCGYDLLAQRPRTPAELHVEVKGTSGTTGHFYMTRNEHAYTSDPRWRLAMVTDALGKSIVRVLTRRELCNKYDVSPLLWEGSER